MNGFLTCGTRRICRRSRPAPPAGLIPSAGRLLLALLLLAALPSAPAAAQVPATGGTAEVTVAASPDAAVAAAHATGRPILALFLAGYSDHCKKLKAALEADPAATAFLRRFILLTLDDGPKDRDFRDRCDVRAFPTALLLTADLEPVGRVVGNLPPAEWVTKLDQFLKDKSKR